MSDRKPSLILPVAVTLTVLLALYVGAYYWLVVPVDGPHSIFAAYLPAERYIHHDWWKCAFTPIHGLDRRIRPHVWEPAP